MPPDREHVRAPRYPVVLPRNTDRPWNAELVDYWQRLGNWVGESAKAACAAGERRGRRRSRYLDSSGRSCCRVTPVDLNIVTERLNRSTDELFDFVVATNILLYYDVFEQSLAAANIATMLPPGGFLLTNNRIFELPDSPLSGVGYTDVVYMSLPGIGDAGDRVVWYQKQ